MASTSTDYSDRTFSLAVTDTIEPVNRTVRLGFSTNRSVTGVQKLVERYIVFLFEMLGSSAYSRTMGTELIASLLNGAVISRGQVSGILNFANSRAAQQLLASETTDDHDDERIKTSSLTVKSLVGDTLSFLVHIETRAGTAVQFLLPTTVATP